MVVGLAVTNDNAFAGDIDNQTVAANYLYDGNGNQVKDRKEGIDTILWNVYGKIKQVTKGAVVTTYTYDASGNRISKIVNGKETWYMRDAGGNIMAVYNIGYGSLNGGAVTLSEQNLYGSSRLGIYKPNIKLSGVLNIDLGTPLTGLNSTGYKIGFERGRKNFELVNHLGNVLVTISDKKIGIDNNNDTLINYYLADVVSASDYYPGGMGMPGRTYNAGTGYRYGFNGQEKDTTINPSHYTAEFWEYDARSVRRWNIDPINKEYESPYSVFGNNPIFNIDPLGNDTTRYSVQKGDNLTKISKKFNVPVEYITQLNKLSDPNKLQTGQVIDIVDNNDLKYGSPERAFSDGVLTKYNNPTNNKYSFSVTATVRELNSEFTLGTIPSFQNTAIVGGPLFDEVKKLSSVQALVAQGLKSLSLDKKYTPGEIFTSTYSIGSITGRTGRGIISQAVKDLFSSKSLSENKRDPLPKKYLD